MQITGGLRNDQRKALLKEINKLELTDRKRQVLLKRMARNGVIAAAKRHQKQQKNPDGSPWSPRKKGKQKMLRKLPKLLTIKEIPERQAVKIYLRGGKVTNLIGLRHDQGEKVTKNASDYKRDNNQRTKEVTAKQATELFKLGFQMWNGRRYVRAKKSAIPGLLNRAQAGLIIRKLKGEPSKQVWSIEIPSRVFLGLSDEEFNKMMARELRGIQYGGNVRASDIKGK